MSIQYPEMLTVECDDCGEQEEIEVTPYTGGDLGSYGVSTTTLEEHEWGYDGGETYCPNCMKKFREEEGIA